MAEKTEKPTAKKLRDAAKKGQTFKARDIVALIVIATGALAAPALVDLTRIAAEFVRIASTGAQPNPGAYAFAWAKLFLRIAAPFVLLCAAAGALPSLVQSRFTLAVESIRFDLTALDPVKGMKRLFSWRSAKDAVKALLYVGVFALTVRVFAGLYHADVFGLFRARPALLGHMWIVLTVRLVLLFLLCALPVLILDAAVEYFLYHRELKMDKHEVKQEYKESEGNHEIKSKRREIHQELLSEEIKANVEQSDFIVANPTHIAIGVYVNPDIVPIPFVSVRETNARALAVIRHAEACGVPVVRNVALARSIYRNSPRRYSFVSHDDIDGVMRVLIWLGEVEAANRGGPPPETRAPTSAGPQARDGVAPPGDACADNAFPDDAPPGAAAPNAGSPDGPAPDGGAPARTGDQNA
ncbi:EscU/YscU/HrcU family type III secretion system export apparatus switch protein [Burkholderia pseudomallei]|uniref:EscU/YscU/HrcU family type III secretion system export apparatus switch protein n=1 Tax=Burkholderia pseudomallei TaxID=28450 RepID=UPI001A9E0FC8|nr:EscU/YscU/HrcU family type III secretion system export apparatus switch protein [Burkholderia pseudomallei]MBO2958276.1 SctU family type III secretion system export apparatus subunit BsaZ [Burkholderia pseudomallei]MBO2976059.1 SctU family type III secretion system export apparatus subunit BsaZ [Burkholderia pseudomallei]MBO3061080.1 SctU family type III secretion system export apparatus subunit BsaZ [Burkholderia pseudomallei]MBO7795000.1 SctU family type III secretion system export apparat